MVLTFGHSINYINSAILAKGICVNYVSETSLWTASKSAISRRTSCLSSHLDSTELLWLHGVSCGLDFRESEASVWTTSKFKKSILPPRPYGPPWVPWTSWGVMGPEFPRIRNPSLDNEQKCNCKTNCRQCHLGSRELLGLHGVSWVLDFREAETSVWKKQM